MQCSNLTVDGSKQQCVKRSRNVYVHNVYELNCPGLQITFFPAGNISCNIQRISFTFTSLD